MIGQRRSRRSFSWNSNGRAAIECNSRIPNGRAAIENATTIPNLPRIDKECGEREIRLNRAALRRHRGFFRENRAARRRRRKILTFRGQNNGSTRKLYSKLGHSNSTTKNENKNRNRTSAGRRLGERRKSAGQGQLLSLSLLSFSY